MVGMVGLVADTVSTSVLVAVPPPFEAEITMFAVPTDEGVPLMTPLNVLIDSPPGRPVAPKDVGVWVATME